MKVDYLVKKIYSKRAIEKVEEKIKKMGINNNYNINIYLKAKLVLLIFVFIVSFTTVKIVIFNEI